MRIMGLDYGSVTVGVAVSDGLLLTAQPVEVIKRKSETKLRQTLARIDALIAEYEVERIVLGLPKNMNNTSGERVQKTEEFKEKLEKRTGLEVIFWDERLSTVSAMEVLKEGNVRRENRKQYVDKIAATFILQGYLDSLQPWQTMVQLCSPLRMAVRMLFLCGKKRISPEDNICSYPMWIRHRKKTKKQMTKRFH